MAVIGFLDSGVQATPGGDYVYSLFLFDSVSGAQLAQVTLDSQSYNYGTGSLSRDGKTLAILGVNEKFIRFCDTQTGNIGKTQLIDYASSNTYGFGPDGTFYKYVFGQPGYLLTIPAPYTTPVTTLWQGDPIMDFSVTGIQDIAIISTRDPNTGEASGIYRLNLTTLEKTTYIDLNQTEWAFGPYVGVMATPDAKFMALSPANYQQNITTFDAEAALLTTSDSSGQNYYKTANAGFTGDSARLVYRYSGTSLAVRDLTTGSLNIRDFQTQLDDSANGDMAADYVLVGMVDDSHVLLNNTGLLAVMNIDSGVIDTRINKRYLGMYSSQGLPVAYRNLGVASAPPQPTGFWQDFARAYEVA